MSLTIYTKDADDQLIEKVKIKAIREKVSVSEAALRLLKLWADGKITLGGGPR